MFHSPASAPHHYPCRLQITTALLAQGPATGTLPPNLARNVKEIKFIIGMWASVCVRLNIIYRTVGYASPAKNPDIGIWRPQAAKIVQGGRPITRAVKIVNARLQSPFSITRIPASSAAHHPFGVLWRNNVWNALKVSFCTKIISTASVPIRHLILPWIIVAFLVALNGISTQRNAQFVRQERSGMPLWSSAFAQAKSLIRRAAINVWNVYNLGIGLLSAKYAWHVEKDWSWTKKVKSVCVHHRLRFLIKIGFALGAPHFGICRHKNASLAKVRRSGQPQSKDVFAHSIETIRILLATALPVAPRPSGMESIWSAWLVPQDNKLTKILWNADVLQIALI
jgi:hypothetical protein